jgi:hypothetical protein
MGWELLPHRISHLELTFLSADAPTGGVVVARNDGGSFGQVDTPGARYGMEVWQSRQLIVRGASVLLEIPPGAEVDGEAFSVREVARYPVDSFDEASVLVAFLRGYQVTTDRYEEPPLFETDPDLPYDPVDGYTTQGIGIALGEPVRDGDEVVVEVTARNSLGLSDRADMNGAIPQASSWFRVDFVIVGVRGSAAVRRGEVAYTMSTAEYGERTDHQHAPEAEQQIVFDGVADLRRALFGLTAFDVWVNVDGHGDPACVVVQDEINSWGEAVSGPGRYLTELGVRLWDTQYDAASGAGGAKLDLFFSNRSEYKEVGNLCTGAAGEIAMLQLDDAEAVRLIPEPVSWTFESGEPSSVDVNW